MKTIIALAATLFLASGLAQARVVDESRLITDNDAYETPDIAKPDYLMPILDPVFGTLITRISDPGRPVLNPTGDPSLDGLVWADRARHHYSLDPVWNADMSLLELTMGTPGSVFLDGQTYEPLFQATPPGRHRWHPTWADIKIYLHNGTGEIGYWNVRTGEKTVIASLDGYTGTYLGPNKGNFSNDGRMVAVYATRESDGKKVAFAFDLELARRYPDIELDRFAESIKYVTISPLGNYIVLRGTLYGRLNPDRGDNILVFDLEGNPTGPLWADYGEPSHNDLVVDGSGDEVAVGVAKSGTHKGKMIKRRLSDGRITALSDVIWGSHTSARNLERSGFVYVTTGPGSITYQAEVFGIRTDGNPTAPQRYGHTHSSGGSGYYGESHGAPSPDGTKVIFASDWGDAGGQIAAYVVELPTMVMEPPPSEPPPEPPEPTPPPEPPAPPPELDLAAIEALLLESISLQLEALELLSVE